MRESTYTASVGKLLPPTVYALKINLRYAKGVADCWYSGAENDLWVEWKYFKRIPRVVDLTSGEDPIITRLQQSWLRDRHNEGRNVAVIVGCKKGGVIYPGLDWETPISQEEFDRRLVSKRELADWINNQVCIV